MSYATEIRTRMVNFDCIMDSGVNSAEIQILRTGSTRIGIQFRWKSPTRYTQARDTDTDWVVRTYTDGTAFVYWRKLSDRLNIPTYDSIRAVIDEHYIVLKVIDHPDAIHMWDDRQLTVYRRKPSSRLSGMWVSGASGFSDYLREKYNVRGDV